MLESKRDGEEIIVAEEVEQPAAVIDIMDALKESLARAKKDAPSAANKKAVRRSEPRRPRARRRPQPVSSALRRSSVLDLTSAA